MRELEEARRELAGARARYEALGGELAEVKNILAAHKDSRARSDAERRMESAVEDMKRLFPGVRGRLSDLVAPTGKGVKVAVTVALGRHMDAVVGNSEGAAFECVEWLRANKVRPMMFLPLDGLAPAPVGDELAAAVRGFRPASGGAAPRFVRDCLRYDPEVERAVAYACGATVVVDTLEDANELRWRRRVGVKVVTADGTLIAKNGNMTGGVSSLDRDLERTSKWDEKEVRAAGARRDELLAEEEVLRRKTAKTRGGGGESLFVAIEDMETAVSTAATRLGVVAKELEAVGRALAAASGEAARVA